MSKRQAQVGPDDLTQVRGIGQATAGALAEAGITTFATLARTAPAELSAVLESTSPRSAGRIASEGWTTQAAALAAGTPFSRTPATDAGRPLRPARYSFSLTLRVDVTTRQVLSCKIIDAQTDDTISLHGFDIDALQAYLRERAALPERGPLGAQSGIPRHDAATETTSTYPVARGSAALPALTPGNLPGSIHVRFDPTTLTTAPPSRSHAILEVHARRDSNDAMTMLGRTTIEIGAQAVETDIPVVIPASRTPLDGRITLWIMAPGERPNPQPATIPSLELAVA